MAAGSGVGPGWVVALPTRRGTVDLGAALASAVRPGDLVVLEGDLGAGKTFLARAVCRALGVPASVRVTSPTFTLVHELRGWIPITHADLYRVSHPGELDELGLRERRAEGSVLLVEWGAAHASSLGGDALVVELFIRTDEGPDAGRSAAITWTGPRGAELTVGIRSSLAATRGRMIKDRRRGERR